MIICSYIINITHQ